MPSVAALRPDAAVAAGDIQRLAVGDFAPLVVVRAANLLLTVQAELVQMSVDTLHQLRFGRYFDDVNDSLYNELSSKGR